MNRLHPHSLPQTGHPTGNHGNPLLTTLPSWPTARGMTLAKAAQPDPSWFSLPPCAPHRFPNHQLLPCLTASVHLGACPSVPLPAGFPSSSPQSRCLPAFGTHMLPPPVTESPKGHGFRGHSTGLTAALPMGWAGKPSFVLSYFCNRKGIP